MGAPAIVLAAAAVSLISSGISAYGQIQTANESAKIQADQIRQQKLQVRLQQNQASLERMSKLEKTLATTQVAFGSRNIAGGSSGERGLTQENYHNFLDDEEAAKLNGASQQMALARQMQLNEMQRKAQVFNAGLGFIKESANTVMSVYGVPSQSLIDQAAKPNASAGYTNTGGSAGAQSYQRNQFNLNA